MPTHCIIAHTYLSSFPFSICVSKYFIFIYMVHAYVLYKNIHTCMYTHKYKHMYCRYTQYNSFITQVFENVRKIMFFSQNLVLNSSFLQIQPHSDYHLHHHTSPSHNTSNKSGLPRKLLQLIHKRCNMGIYVFIYMLSLTMHRNQYGYNTNDAIITMLSYYNVQGKS